MRVLVLGSGMMGSALAYDLARSKEVTQVGIAGRTLSKVRALARRIGKKAKAHKVDASNIREIARLMKPYDVAIGAISYEYNLGLSKAAIKSGTHFLDLGGNNTVVNEQLKLNGQAKKANITIIPDCGLAPGLVNLLAADAVKRKGGKANHVDIRVGGLPQHPKGPLSYMLVFSVKGLINEYVEPTFVLKNGRKKVAPILGDLEKMTFKGFPPLEACNTSGGASTLVKSMKGKVKNLDYKTIRYRGHVEKIRLLYDLKMLEGEMRNQVEKHLKKILAYKDKDLVLVRVTCDGLKYEIIDKDDGKHTAMQRMTAFPTSIVAQMVGKCKAPLGVKCLECAIDTKEFIPQLKSRKIRLKIS